MSLDIEMTALLMMAWVSTLPWLSLGQGAPALQSSSVLVFEGHSDVGTKPGTSLPSACRLPGNTVSTLKC